MASVKIVSRNPNTAKLSDAQLKGYEWLKTVGEASTREYSVHFDIGYKTAQRHLAAMKEFGLIKDNGVLATSPNFKYLVTD
jgi:predicted HTH transcriptional regulator